MKASFLVLVLSLVAFSASAQSVSGPAPTDFQSNRCAQCGMVVASRTYAAQIVGAAQPLFFDDIGCLVQYERQKKIAPTAVQARYVRAVNADQWLLVDQAFWVLTKDVRTPMGYGLHAFTSKAAAEAFAQGKQGAKLLSWSDVPAAVPAGMGMM